MISQNLRIWFNAWGKFTISREERQTRMRIFFRSLLLLFLRWILNWKIFVFSVRLIPRQQNDEINKAFSAKLKKSYVLLTFWFVVTQMKEMKTEWQIRKWIRFEIYVHNHYLEAMMTWIFLSNINKKWKFLKFLNFGSLKRKIIKIFT